MPPPPTPTPPPRRGAGGSGPGGGGSLAGSASGGGGFFLGRIVMAAPPSTPQQTRRGERRERNPDEGATVVREARWEQQGLDKEIRTPVREPQAVRRSRPEEIPDVKSNGVVQRRIGSLFSLQVQPSLLLPCSGIRLQRKHNQNKHLFAPPLRRFLNYRVGLPWMCACTRGHSPRLLLGSTWAKSLPL